MSGVEMPLPAGWEAKKTKEGKTFYVDHWSKTTTWVHPYEVAKGGAPAAAGPKPPCDFIEQKEAPCVPALDTSNDEELARALQMSWGGAGGAGISPSAAESDAVLARMLQDSINETGHGGTPTLQVPHPVVVAPAPVPSATRPKPKIDLTTGFADIDNMTAEELLELEAQMGHVDISREVPLVQRVDDFPARTLSARDISGFRSEEQRECAICMTEYGVSEVQRRLPCMHSFHRQCIDPWFTSGKDSCPSCNTVVISITTRR